MRVTGTNIDDVIDGRVTVTMTKLTGGGMFTETFYRLTAGNYPIHQKFVFSADNLKESHAA